MFFNVGESIMSNYVLQLLTINLHTYNYCTCMCNMYGMVW